MLLMAAFVAGFNGSLHCFGMCGPVVGVLGMNTQANGKRKKLIAAACYNLGRITTYILLGVVAMLLSVAMNDLKPLQIIMRYLAGIIMLFVALQLMGFPQFLGFIEKPMSKLSRPISSLTRKFFPIKTSFGAYIAGMAWGLMPCGMVYMAFTMSLGVEKVLYAPLVMLFFGLGTLPMMLTLSISGNFFGGFFSSPQARKVAGGIVLLMTLYYMGSMLMGDLGKGGHAGHHGDHSTTEVVHEHAGHNMSHEEAQLEHSEHADHSNHTEATPKHDEHSNHTEHTDHNTHDHGHQNH